jgi:hypothetical protein
MQRYLSKVFLLAAIVLTGIPPTRDACAGMLVLNPTVDGTYSPLTGAIDNTTTLAVGLAEVRTLKDGSLVGGEMMAGLEFQLPALPTGAVIQSATLSLTSLGASAGGAGYRELIYSLHAYMGDGLLDVADFGVSDPIGGPYTASVDGAIDLKGGGANLVLPDLSSVDVTSFVQSLYGSGTEYAGLVLRSDSLPDPTQFFYQRFVGVPSGGKPLVGYPTLTIEFNAPGEAPEPASLLLFAMGIASMASGKLRRRRSMRSLIGDTPPHV